MVFRFIYNDTLPEEICNLLHLDETKGELLFDLPSGLRGSIFFEKGNIIHSEIGELFGLDAVYELLLKTAGTLQFFPNRESTGHTIEIKTKEILATCEERRQELENIKQRLPSLDTILERTVTPTDKETSIDLTLDEWRLLSLVSGHRDIKAILEESDFGEYRTYKIILHLLKNNFLLNPREIADFISQKTKSLNLMLNEFGAKGVGTKIWLGIFQKQLDKLTQKYTFAKSVTLTEQNIINIPEKVDKTISPNEIKLVLENLENYLFQKAKIEYGPRLATYKYEHALKVLSE